MIATARNPYCAELRHSDVAVVTKQRTRDVTSWQSELSDGCLQMAASDRNASLQAGTDQLLFGWIKSDSERPDWTEYVAWKE